MIPTGFSHDQQAQADQALLDMHDSPIQRSLRRDRRWFVSVVLWRPGDVAYDWIVAQLRQIRQLGFNSVRYHNLKPGDAAENQVDLERMDEWMAAAAETDVQVIAHIGSLRPSPEILDRHGVTMDEYLLAHLDEAPWPDVLEETYAPVVRRYGDHPNLLAWGMAGEPNAGDAGIVSDYDRKRFADWLAETHGDLESLDAAWNLYPEKNRPIVASLASAHEALAGFQADWKVSGAHRAKVNYGAARDMLRYLTDKMNTRVGATVRAVHRIDPETPVNLGAHQLFANQPALRWDIRQWAGQSDLFTSSIHLSWHFEAVAGEVDRPVYMQSRRTRDYFKGGWTSAYETTGGAVQYSGGYPNAMTPGLMRRLMLHYLAAGHVNIAFWTWNHRPGGWESGEYGMTSLSGQVTSWARQAGRIAQSIGRYSDELWQARQDPPVGILEDWDTEAIYTLEPDRHDLSAGVGRFGAGTQLQPIRAQIGASRALMNQHVPFEYLRTEELAAGIGPRYPVLYAPHLRALGADKLDAMGAYVQAGGRLVADVQFAFQDPWGKCQPAGPGGPAERIFGAWADVIHDTRTCPMRVNGVEVDGFFADLECTDARVIARFDDGRPAACEILRGKGSAVLVAFDLARMCHRPGSPGAETLLVEWTAGHLQRTWQCSAPLAYRLRSESADHYFLVNDGPERTATLQVWDRQYTEGCDAITDEPIDLSGTITIPLEAASAAWIRLA